ncbi:hypothetical protein CI102_4220 [Trichoderma harzianum]|uniref:Uncharacterized protein n=1 Tax=Trichoderma harzianum CBS 226.95 TaxID=983964 RepID=A0A2T3ZS90_TRIHA|nr:hypothetical protein M431DRAFT_488356 [Trichoderma harzianum CBS 226.95]PKK51483.1 hypothetical protein CI102_4220 [Trichoderma harzianum]PTB47684.1 hypothetical protein M431DRAFT_488356 [Trichoderma harzianum CBS 226.95]
MNWGSFIPSMAATNALHNANPQPLLCDTATHNDLEEPIVMRDLRMNTFEGVINYGFRSLDGSENSDLDLASCLMMNEPMVSFSFTTGNDYKTATTNIRKPIYLDLSKFVHGPDDTEEESAYWTILEAPYADESVSKEKNQVCNYDGGNLCMSPSKPDDQVCWTFAMDCDVSLVDGYSASDAANSKETDETGPEDEEAPGAQNNDIPGFNSLVGSVQPDGLTFKFPPDLQTMIWMESGLSKVEQHKDNDPFREFMSLYFSMVSTIGSVIGYVAAVADMPEVVDATANLGFIVTVGNIILEVCSTLEDPANSRMGCLARFLWQIWLIIRA